MMRILRSRRPTRLATGCDELVEQATEKDRGYSLGERPVAADRAILSMVGGDRFVCARTRRSLRAIMTGQEVSVTPL